MRKNYLNFFLKSCEKFFKIIDDVIGRKIDDVIGHVFKKF